MKRGLAKTWAVIGAGPCGIASVGRLVDLFGGIDANPLPTVYWIDPCFTVGRMGKFYRNVPANTLNSDLLYSMTLCESFEFESDQQKRCLTPDNTAMSLLDADECHALGSFVDALEDATVHLKEKTCHITGQVKSMTAINFIDSAYDGSGMGTALGNLIKTNTKWRLAITKGHCVSGLSSGGNAADEIAIEVDSVIYCCGGIPKVPTLTEGGGASLVPSPQSKFHIHNMDSMVDPVHVDSFRRQSSASIPEDAVWVVVGASHSGMLIVMNLIKTGFTNVICVHKSGWRFHHFTEDGCQMFPGTGLKGPVGKWTKEALGQSKFSSVLYNPLLSWEEQLASLGAQHVVFAVGFEREPGPEILADNDGIKCSLGYDLLQNCDYNKDSGHIYLDDRSQASAPAPNMRFSNLFGGGIAFPQHYINEKQMSDPWVGFKRSIQQVDLMVASSIYKEPNL